MSEQFLFLRVPGAWCNACGLGDEDKTFPVLHIENYGEGRTFVTVSTPTHGEWKVWLEERGATLTTQ